MEDSKLSLDTSVAEILPEFADVKVLDGWDGDEPVFRDPATTCTVRHLATHISGLVYEFWKADQAKLIEAGATSILSGRELDGTRVMTPEAIEWMLANQIGDIDIAVIKSFTPLSADVDFLPGIAKKHSFAFVTNTEDVPGMRKAGSQSWAGVCHTHMWVDPAAGVAG